MKIHRAVTLVLMMLLAVGMFVVMTAGALSNLDEHSVIALAVVLVAAAAGGVAFSWKRYTKRG
jgi:hypothetical protein